MDTSRMFKVNTWKSEGVINGNKHLILKGEIQNVVLDMLSLNHLLAI